MDNKLKSFLEELEDCDGEAEIRRWQLKVKTFLEHRFETKISKKFSDLANTNNIWDDAAKQKGYLEALVYENEDNDFEYEKYKFNVQ